MMEYYNHFANRIIGHALDDAIIMPMNFISSKHYTVKFSGWKNAVLAFDDPVLNQVISLAHKCIKNIVDMYKESHAFETPQFLYNYDGTFEVRISVMEMEVYDQLMIDIETSRLQNDTD